MTPARSCWCGSHLRLLPAVLLRCRVLRRCGIRSSRIFWRSRSASSLSASFTCHDHILMLRQFDACTEECLVKCFVEGLCDTQTLTGGFHFRAKADVSAADLLEGEYRHLDRDIICFRLQVRSDSPVPLIFLPRITLVASGTIGIPVTLLMYGTVRLERGFTSMTYTSSPHTMNWMLISPMTCRDCASFLV